MKKLNLLAWIVVATMVISLVFGIEGYMMLSDPLSFMGEQSWGFVDFVTRVYEIKVMGSDYLDVCYVSMIV